MKSPIDHNFAVFFPLFFGALWLTVTTILAWLSGWFRLMARFPDRIAEPLLQLRWQSCSMGFGVSMSGILTLSVCSTGLRVGIMRVFGIFSRDFFVPWEEIVVTRKNVLFWPTARLQFGTPCVGSLTIPARVANKLARAAMGRWPEAGPFPEEKRRDALQRLLLQWAVMTGIAALFFTLAPMLMARSGAHLPIDVAILLPAIVFGAYTVIRYAGERR